MVGVCCRVGKHVTTIQSCFWKDETTRLPGRSIVKLEDNNKIYFK